VHDDANAPRLGYGPPSGYGCPPGYWPPAPPQDLGRPAKVTTAAVLGLVSGGLTALVVLFLLLMVVLGATVGGSFFLMLLGLPCAVALVNGGVRLLRSRTVQPLRTAAVASVGALLLYLLMAGLLGGSQALLATGAFLVLALPLPVLTVVFAQHPEVRTWAWDG
jgi:hypothetical protein